MSLALLQQNWYNHEGLRYFKKDSFDFKLETHWCVIQMKNLVTESYVKFLLEKLNKHRTIAIEDAGILLKSLYLLFLILLILNLDNTGYTVGKIIEYMLHTRIIIKEKQRKHLTYVGFRKNHPHDEDSVIRRMGFIDRSL